MAPPGYRLGIAPIAYPGATSDELPPNFFHPKLLFDGVLKQSGIIQFRMIRLGF